MGKAKDPFGDAFDLIKRLAQSLFTSSAQVDTRGIFSPGSALQLALSAHERRQYKACLRALGRAVRERDFGDELLRDALNSTLLQIVGDVRNDSFDRTVLTALDQLRRHLLAPPSKYRVAHCIQGISTADLPFTYQGVLFVAASEEALTDALGANCPPDDAIFQFLPYENAEHLSIAVTEVSAHDREAARTGALSLIQDAIDELGGYAALLHTLEPPVVADLFNSVRISMKTLVARSSTDASVRLTIPTAPALVSFAAIRALLNSMSSTRICSLIEHTQDDDVAGRIRSALRFIVRAQQCRAHDRFADSFLYFVVALEALLGRQNRMDSISFQLRFRLAHLIGVDVDERQEIERAMGDLYKLRSDIVHNAMREVQPRDLALAANYAVRAVTAALFASEVSALTKFAEYEAWFSKKLLS